MKPIKVEISPSDACLRRGDVSVTNLQHDGVVVELPDDVTADAVRSGMSDACEAVLGYEQPVEEKELGANVGESEAEDDAE